MDSTPRRGSRGNQAQTADEEETRRRAFWEGRAAAERNRRRAMEDEFSGGAGVDVGVSEEGARLLIDPGTGVYGALGADTAPPDDEELVRAKRDAAEEKAAEATARGERLSTEDSRARADSPPSESKPVADVRAPATSHKRRTPPSSSSDESETDAMDLEESFELPSKFYLGKPCDYRTSTRRRRRGRGRRRSERTSANDSEKVNSTPRTAPWTNSTNATTKIRWSDGCAR